MGSSVPVHLLLLIVGSLILPGSLGHLGGGDGSPACLLPPHLWCRSQETARTCQAEKYCAKLGSDPPKAAPVSVELYFESLCPACRYFHLSTLFLVTQLFPTWLMLNPIMNITMVPYGNTKETKGHSGWEFECQHGLFECQGNMIETCLMHELPDIFQYFPLIFCLESGSDIIQNLPLCLKLYTPKASLTNITSCINGDLGNKLMHQNAERTRALNPPHEYVPWIVINGNHTKELQTLAETSLFQLVCNLYKGEPLPECKDPKSHSSLLRSLPHSWKV